ncbi:hypothetical protein CCR79_02240 [Halorhodospira halophila]|nr:hypothetical protein [Halorhodospira halophila]
MPSRHAILNEEVITALLPGIALKNFFSPDVMCFARKFCIESKTSYARIYRLPRDIPRWVPNKATVIAESINDEEWGRPAPQGIMAFKDIYFVGPPREIEDQFGLPPRRGKYKTCYGATIKGGTIQRVKQYLYDEPDSFSEWERLYEKKMRDIGRSA